MRRPRTDLELAVERAFRPIVEGQIRGFIKEHPSILKGVDWYKPRQDKAQTLTGSLSKRIVRDLACETAIARLAALVLEYSAGPRQSSEVVVRPATKQPWLAASLAMVRRFFGARR